jgi:hypothetical protein
MDTRISVIGMRVVEFFLLLEFLLSAVFIRSQSDNYSRTPVKVLLDVGIDVRKAEFWQGGFDVIKGLVDQLEKIAK